MRGSRGGGAAVPEPPHPVRKQKYIGFISNTGPEPLINHKAMKPALNVWSSSTRQRMAFCWRADDDPFIVVLESSLIIQKKRCQSWTPSDKTFGSAHDRVGIFQNKYITAITTEHDRLTLFMQVAIYVVCG